MPTSTSNINELRARLALLKANVKAGVFSDALVGGLSAGMAFMKKRIFNESKDAQGKSLGRYKSNGYKRKRVKAGRQIARKDLEYLGSLRRSIEVVNVNDLRAEIRITNVETARIARYQEYQIANIRAGQRANRRRTDGAPIFVLNREERERVSRTIRALLKQKFENL